MRDAVPLGARPGGGGSGDDDEGDDGAGASPGDDGGDGTEVKKRMDGEIGKVGSAPFISLTHTLFLFSGR